MTDEELIEACRFIVSTTLFPKVKDVCKEILRRHEAGTLRKRSSKDRHREYMRGYMSKRRAKARLRALAAIRAAQTPAVIDDESIKFLDE